MKKSRAVSVSLVPLVAASFAACGGNSTPRTLDATHQRVCVDQQQRVVEDTICQEPRRSGGFFPYYWYFMPFRAGGYPLGAPLTGGSLIAPGADARVATGRVVARGGFGTTARSVVS